jgi:outer membrane lipoprotein carrier protein
MRWDYLRPAGKLFISDGKTVYLYSASENRVEKMPLKDTEDMRAPLAFLLGQARHEEGISRFFNPPRRRWRCLARRSIQE